MPAVRQLQAQQAPRPGVPIPLGMEDNTPKDPTYPMLVVPKNATKEKCRECANRKEVVQGAGGIPVEVLVGADPRCPFCNGTGWVLRRVQAQSAAHHSSLVGYEVGPDGQRAYRLPPTVAEYMQNGIDRADAEKYAAKQAAKAAKGFAPYGPLPDPDDSTGQNAPAAPVGDPLSEGF